MCKRRAKGDLMSPAIAVGVGDTMLPGGLIDELPPDQRLALSYAPASIRSQTMALLVLDRRLAAIVRTAKEPLIAQIKLAWWRERLGELGGQCQLSEPLLANLQPLSGERATLASMVDGWELLLGEAPLPASALLRHAQYRSAGFAALARTAGYDEAATDAQRMAQGWALADLARHISNADEIAAVRRLIDHHEWQPARLPRVLRPLAVLHGLARRETTGNRQPILTILAAIRLGLLGR